jgi:PAS domain S-box-containing protein
VFNRSISRTVRDRPRVATCWWLDAILMAFGIAAMEFCLHSLLLSLDLRLSAIAESVLHGVAFGLVFGPTFALHLYRRERNQRTDRERLHQSEEAYRVLFDTAPAAVCVCDANGMIQNYNQRAAELWGYRPAVGVTRHAGAKQLSGADGSEWADENALIRQVTRTGEPVWLVEFELERPDGSSIPVLANYAPLRDTGKRIIGVLVSFDDISVRKQSEEELRRSGAKFRTLFESSSDAVILYDQNGFLDCNPAALQIFGCKTAEEFCDRNFVSLSAAKQPCGQDSVTALNQRIAEAFATGSSRFDWIYLRADSTETFYAEVLLNAFELNGRPTLQAVVRDITYRKRMAEEVLRSKMQAERALREVNALRSALDEHSLLSVANRSGKIIDVNTGFCRISGYSREELLGRDHRILNSGVHSKQFWSDVWRSISAGRAWRGEVCNRRKDGSIYWVDSTIIPYLGNDGRVEKYVSIRFDITQQKATETDLVKARMEAQAANRSKSEFIANMSHEIRTPMTAILGFADLLAIEGDRSKAPRQRLEYIDTIRRNGEHLLAIINDILDLSKIEAGKMRVETVETSPAQIVQEVLLLMEVKAQAKGLKLHAEFHSATPETIQSDPVRLRQILVNLIGNAIKFTELGEVCLKVSCDRDAELLYFDVVDTGIGLTQEHIQRLFEAFEQADTSTTRRFGGTGLGLRISRRLAEILGGEISVTSEAGIGCTFRASIATGPLETRRMLSAEESLLAIKHKRAAAKVNTRRSAVLAGKRILFAEDGPDNQRLIAFHLRQAGAEVQVVENGRLALESLTVGHTLDGPLLEPPPFDLIISDMQMPEMDGYAATRLLRKKGCTLPIIALTAHAMSGDRDRCERAGCDDYATKPIDRDALIATCARWLHLAVPTHLTTTSR